MFVYGRAVPLCVPGRSRPPLTYLKRRGQLLRLPTVQRTRLPPFHRLLPPPENGSLVKALLGSHSLRTSAPVVHSADKRDGSTQEIHPSLDNYYSNLAICQTRPRTHLLSLIVVSK